MRVLGDWVEALLADNGVAEGGKKPIEDALQSDDAGVRERAAELLIGAISRAKPAPRATIVHILQTSYWPPSPGMAARAFSATLPIAEESAEDAPETVDLPLLWANLARANPDVANSVGDALMHERSTVRRIAAGAVGRMGRNAREHMPSLARLLNDTEGKVAQTALESLSALGPLDLDLALGAFRAETRAAKGPRRFQALSALRGLLEHTRIVGAAISPDEPADEQALIDSASDPETAIRLQAVGLLGLRGILGPNVETALRNALKDESPEVRAASAIALLRLGCAANEALDLLRGQLTSEDQAKQDATVYALEPLDVPILALARPALETAAESAKGVAKEAAVGLLLRLERAANTRS